MERIEPVGYDVVGLRADNPGPLTLSGTNSWIVGSVPAWLIDPGPALPDHIDALRTEIQRRGGLGGIALTHDHGDHREAVVPLREHFTGAPVAGARGEVDVLLGDGEGFGPLRALALPGHSPDHLVYISDRVGFSGDAVLGEGSVFVAADPGALTGYLDGLRRLRECRLALLCPGHGPLIEDPDAKLAEYLDHRRERERRLLDALHAGARTVDAMLDAAWTEVPAGLRPAAAITLAAHLDKLEGEGRLPADVQRPQLPAVLDGP